MCQSESAFHKKILVIGHSLMRYLNNMILPNKILSSTKNRKLMQVKAVPKTAKIAADIDCGKFLVYFLISMKAELIF